jgi:hypothetical protein
VLLRTLGVIPLLLATALHWRRRDRHWALPLLVASPALAGWIAWTAAHGEALPAVLAPAYGPYGAYWAGAFREFGPPVLWLALTANLSRLPTVAAAFTDGLPAPVAAGLAGLVAALTLVGLLRARHALPVALLGSAGYLSVVLLWPFDPSRLLWPLWPMVVLGLWQALGALRARARGRPLAVGVGGALLLLFAWRQADALRTRRWEAREAAVAATNAIALAVANTLPPDARLAADSETLIALYTGRPVRPLLPLVARDYLRPDPPAGLAARLDSVITATTPSHLLVSSRRSLQGARYLEAASPPRVALRGAWEGGVALFEVLPPP